MNNSKKVNEKCSKKDHKKVYSRSDKAITLIALIVAIIVLLILAGVTINLAVNNQGIFNKAKTATRAFKNASENEQTGLDEANKEIAKYMPKEGSEGGSGSESSGGTTGSGSSDSGGSVTSPDAPTTTNYTGYYADVNDDGIVDGVIFIDLAYGASGQWGDGDGKYSYSAVTSGLSSYKISTKTSSYSGKFGTKSVIAPNGTSGSPRFYVMALSDFDTSTHTWSDACSKNQTVGSVKFRLPSKMEWAAFGGQFGITGSDYSSKYGLSGWCWSSTERDSSRAWIALFRSGYMTIYGKTDYYSVRLCATF